MRSDGAGSQAPASTCSTTSPSSRTIPSSRSPAWCCRRTMPGRRPKSFATASCAPSRTSRTISPGSRPTSSSLPSSRGDEPRAEGSDHMAVTALRITQRSTVLDGRPFGTVGAYEKIIGVLRIGVDPLNPANGAIADLGTAPRNAAGLVECEADFYLLKPQNGARGNHRLLLDVPNRGRKVALGMLNSTPRVPDPTTPEDFGNGFLMRW